jgi:hypothetical protein
MSKSAPALASLLTFSDEDLKFGRYIKESARLVIEKEYPDIQARWGAYLDAQCDPGMYDSYKVKDPAVLPYVDGKPQWVCDIFMPAELVKELKSRMENEQ